MNRPPSRALMQQFLRAAEQAEAARLSRGPDGRRWCVWGPDLLRCVTPAEYQAKVRAMMHTPTWTPDENTMRGSRPGDWDERPVSDRTPAFPPISDEERFIDRDPLPGDYALKGRVRVYEFANGTTLVARYDDTWATLEWQGHTEVMQSMRIPFAALGALSEELFQCTLDFDTTVAVETNET